MNKPRLILVNQYGEKTFNFVLSDEVDQYAGPGSDQVVGPDMNLDADAGSNSPTSPKFIATFMGNIIGDAMTKVANYLAGVIGAYTITGTKATRYPTGGVIGIISDGVTDVDGAVVAHLDGDSSLTVANAAFKAMMKNTTPNSGFNYGLDLTEAAVDGYPALAILKADLRLSNNVCVFSGATAPVNGTTGDNFAGPGSLYIARDTGAVYKQTSLITTPVWELLADGANAISALLTGFSAGAGTVASTDTILQGIDKLAGNTQNRAVTANVLTGLAAGTNAAIASTDTILAALAKLQAQIDAL